MGKSTECCNQDCNQGRTCPQRNAGRVQVHNMSLHASKGGMLNAATGVTLAADRVGTVYVSGPMTGYEDWNFSAFNAAADALRSQGYKVINPADHGVVPGAEWEDYLRKDVADLAACEAIHLLPGWSQSKGARLELHLAKALGLRVMYAEGAEHADAAAVDHHPLHQHLLHMLGAKDHVDAGRIIAQHHLRELAAEQQGVQRIQANCYSDDDGDYWRDCPDDCDFVEGLKVGDTFELQASVRAWSETFRVTKAPDEESDDYEVELVSSDAPIATSPTPQRLDTLKALGWAATINGVHFRRFGDWLPDDDCYDHGTLVKLFALPVSEEEAQAERDAAQAKQEAAA